MHAIVRRSGPFDSAVAFGYEAGDFTYHSVMLTFAPLSHRLLSEAPPQTIRFRTHQEYDLARTDRITLKRSSRGVYL